MATSSKVVFKLEVLRQKALEAIDEQIHLAQQHVDSYQSEEVWKQRVKDWRSVQEQKISHLFSKLGGDDVSDYELSKFRLDTYPEADRYDAQRSESTLRQLQSRKTQIVAKSESLVGDEDGNIALTKTQLSEFFGL